MFYPAATMERDALFEIGRRTFDTPEFRGIEFIEVEAKSIINHVPGKFLPGNLLRRPRLPSHQAVLACPHRRRAQAARPLAHRPR